MIRPLRLIALSCALAASPVSAQAPTKIRFGLDWVVQGQHAFFFNTLGRGYFRQEGLDVTIDGGAGSGATIQRVATSYDMGFADLGYLVEAIGNNPDVLKVQGVYLVYEKSPNSLLIPKRAGVNALTDLKGKRLGAPTTSPVFRAWPLFAKANGLKVDDVSWVHVAPNLVEPTVMQGNADIGTGHPTQAVLFYRLGLKPEELRIVKYAEHGVNMYGHAIVVNTDFAKKNPQAVSAFLRAFNRGLKETLAEPAAATKYVVQTVSTLVESEELLKLSLVLDLIDTPNARADGLGAVRTEILEKMATDMHSAFNMKSKPSPDVIFNSSFLPTRSERQIAPR